MGYILSWTGPSEVMTAVASDQRRLCGWGNVVLPSSPVNRLRAQSKTRTRPFLWAVDN